MENEKEKEENEIFRDHHGGSCGSGAGSVPVSSDVSVVVMCRRGVDSVTATKLLVAWEIPHVFNLQGGLQSWREMIDDKFPQY